MDTKCEKCYFALYTDLIQTGCSRNRLAIWQSKDKASFDGRSYTVETICNMYCETQAHAEQIDNIIFPTCDIIVVVDNITEDVSDDILSTCQQIANMKYKPTSVTIASSNKHILYSDLSRELADILHEIPYSIIRWYEYDGISKMVDEAIRKTGKSRKLPSRYIMTVTPGSYVHVDIMKKLNDLENVYMVPFLAIAGDHPYNRVLINRLAYNMMDKNINEWAITKLTTKAKEENNEHLILNWSVVCE